MENLQENPQNSPASVSENIYVDDRIIAACNYWWEYGEKVYNLPPEKFQIFFTLSGVKAGQASILLSAKEFSVNFNLPMAEENEEEFISQVVPHEIAHIIADRFFGQNCHHSDLWRSVMVKFGKSPDRCHQFSVENHSQSRRDFEWKCSGCGVKFSVGKNMHKKLQRIGSRRCRKCHSINFQFVSFKNGFDL